METATAAAAEQILILLIIILFSGVFFSKLSQVLHLPDVVLFILGGILIGPYALNLVSVARYPVWNQLILTLGAAFILYDGGREINLKILNEVKVSVILLSTIGVLISSFITGFFAMKIFNMTFIYALLLGSVIASTDPSVLVPLFKNMSIRERLKQTIISESAFNDAAAAIMTFSVIAIITSNTFSLSHSIIDLFVTSLGGILIGVIVGIILVLLVCEGSFGVFYEHPSILSLIAVMTAYVVSTYFGVSGFMAVFVVGILSGNKHMIGLHLHEQHEITHDRFKDVLVTILRVMIFTILGTQVDFAMLSRNWAGALLIVLLLVFVARPISVILTVSMDRKASWTVQEVVYLMWTRETGVIPAALAGMLISMKIANSDIISSVTTMAILITLTVQASTSKYLAKLLRLDKE